MKKNKCSFAGSFAKEIQEWADSVNSGQSLAGRVLVVFVFFCNLMSMVIWFATSFSNQYCCVQGLYIIDTTSQTYVEECIVWQEKETLIVSLATQICSFKMSTFILFHHISAEYCEIFKI